MSERYTWRPSPVVFHFIKARSYPGESFNATVNRLLRSLWVLICAGNAPAFTPLEGVGQEEPQSFRATPEAEKVLELCQQPKLRDKIEQALQWALQVPNPTPIASADDCLTVLRRFQTPEIEIEVVLDHLTMFCSDRDARYYLSELDRQGCIQLIRQQGNRGGYRFFGKRIKAIQISVDR